jgi:sensor histidine kinase YesM
MTRVRGALLYTACWLPVVALYATAVWLGGGATATQSMFSGLLNTTVPWLGGAAIWWLSGVLPIRRTGRVTVGVVHLVCAVAFSTLWTGGMVNRLHAIGMLDMRVILNTIAPWQWISGLFVYVMVAAISYVIRDQRRARALELAAERSERLRVQAELQALRAHINPHFLFNSLHAVTQLLHRDPTRAEQALERLATLFRYALRLDREQIELVTVEDEWQFVQDYLWLEQLRLGSRLSVEVDIEDDVLECVVPPFSLQPLVENAIRHGIAPLARDGHLTIRAHERDGTLLLSVSDDGAGAQTPTNGSRGVGLRAVTQRLQSQFGDQVTHRVTTAPGAGYSIELSFPARSLAESSRMAVR